MDFAIELSVIPRHAINAPTKVTVLGENRSANIDAIGAGNTSSLRLAAEFSPI